MEPARPRSGPDRLTLLAFAGAVVLGGGNFLAVKFSNEALPPLFGAALRFTGGAAVLFLLSRARGTRLPSGRDAWGAVVYGVLNFGLAYAFIYYALVGLSAGGTSIILASAPLLTLALAVLHGQERFSGRGVLGGLLALTGIAILSARTLESDVRPVYLLSALLGASAAAEASVVAKGLPRLDPVLTNGIGMTAGAGLLWIASFAFGERWALPTTPRTWLVVAYLVLLGSVALFILFLYVIERWTASAAIYALALMPVVAVTLGALLAHEPVTPQLVAGGALVMSAVWVGALSRPR